MNIESQFLTPILFIIFNRPDTTQLVFERIKMIKPKYLYVSADGPRTNNSNDKINCELARRIIDQVDWNCEVKRLFHNQNYGCKNAVSKGITWFFENVDEGIILEDDVVPDLTFFSFCSEMLKTYRNNKQVMHIGGNNFHQGKFERNDSYYFSVYPHIWGWATWKRAWDNYDVEVKTFEKFKEQKIIESVLKNKKAQRYWLKKFEMMYDSRIDTWDYQWVYTIWHNHGICITPNCNLAMNIGFGNAATHTNFINPIFKNQKIEQILEIVHPNKILLNEIADHYTFNKIFSPNIFVKFRIKTTELFYLLRKIITKSKAILLY